MELWKPKRHFLAQITASFPNVDIFLMIYLYEPLTGRLDDAEGMYK